MSTLFRCDQCVYEEWRDDDQEPWLCAVCGNMRWERIAVSDDSESPEEEGDTAG
ncbi:MAG: hypothetical protein ACE5HV_10540 [Acidobacteriota bacterium]